MTVDDSARTDLQQLLAQPLALTEVFDTVIRGLFFNGAQVRNRPVTEDDVVTDVRVAFKRRKPPQQRTAHAAGPGDSVCCGIEIHKLYAAQAEREVARAYLTLEPVHQVLVEAADNVVITKRCIYRDRTA